MPSPFPGMDPYLEKHWGDVHHRLVTYAADRLQPKLPHGLRARLEERVYVESDAPRSIYPDVRVVEHRQIQLPSRNDRGAVAVDEPIVISLADEAATQGYIEIIDVRSGGRVVTVLEFLSPANKVAGDGKKKYLQKQQELIEGGVSLVEIDLIREGEWVMAFPFAALPASSDAIYRVVVRRGWKPCEAEYYRIPLEFRLPTIKVPLRETDADVPLDLQALIEQCYANGGYDDIDYASPLEPPLAPAEARWVKRVLRDKGKLARRKPKKKP